MSYTPTKVPSYLFMNTKAAEHEPPPADAFGVRCRKYRRQMGRLLHRMSESGCTLLQNEAEHMRRCGLLLDVQQTHVGSFVERTVCGRPACIFCGNRSGRISSNYIQFGIDFHRGMGNELFFVTTSYPPIVGEDVAKYFDKAQSVHRQFIQILSDSFDPDWHVDFEITESPTGLRIHAHYLIATPINCPPPRKTAARRVALSAVEAFFPSGQPLTMRRVLKGIRAAGARAISSVFPDAAAVLANKDVLRRVVNIRKLRRDAQTPGKVSGYVSKAMPCGLTVKQLGSVSMETLARLLGAIRPQGSHRARKMSQSRAGSWFSRRPATESVARPRRKIPTPKAKPEVRHDALVKLVDDFLADRQLPAHRLQWFADVGDVLAGALTNDRDSRGLALCFKMMAVRRVQQPLPCPEHYQGPSPSLLPSGFSSGAIAGCPS